MSRVSERALAKAAGAKLYETGRPCMHGHIAPRWTCNGKCRGCQLEESASAAGRAISRAKYERHADAIKKRARRWAAENPERQRLCAIASESNARARRAGAEGWLSWHDIEAVLASGQCAACASPSFPVVDHALPLSRGGSNLPANLQRLCFPCNARKHTLTMAEFMARRAA